MKNHISNIAVIVAALMLTGCVKDSLTDITGQLVFTASIENGDTRTILSDGNRICWEAGDEISVNGTIYTAAPDASNATLATFTKKDENAAEPSGTFTAVYPAGIYADGGFSLPATQTLNPENSFSGINPMYAQSNSTSLVFKNLCGVLKLSLKGSETIRSITVSDAEQALSGAFKVADDGSAVLTDAAKAALCGVTLDCGEGVALCEEGTVFHIAVPAGNYNALSITVTNNDGITFTANLREGVTAVISRSTLYPIELVPEFSGMTTASGVFSVDYFQQVQFAPGNLYYDGEKWEFEQQQYDYAETWNTSHVSHFFWTSSSSSADATYYSPYGATIDWGAAYCESHGLDTYQWYSLSAEEWDYLLNSRSMANDKPRFSNAASSPVTIEGKQYCGLFIYPDDYDGSIVDDSFTWSRINSAGIIYLPAAGRRSGTGLSYCGAYGYYWTSTSFSDKISKGIRIGANGVNTDYAFGRYAGYSVRLVTKAK